MREIRGLPAKIINHLFQVLLVTYLILLMMEQIWTGIVSAYLNLTYFLILVIFLGILDIFSEKPFFVSRTPSWKDYSFISVLGVLALVIIKYKTASLGWLSWLVSIVAGILIILLSILILQDDDS